ncbi:MAG: ATP cone domain-containing protein [bacterium]|nr:ATP cone domain-containing protein [bacterium]
MATQQTNLWGKADDTSGASLVKRVQKRNGTIVAFNREKIVRAVDRAMRSAHEGSLDEADKVADAVIRDIASIAIKYRTFVPTVEGIQDTVERELIIGQYAQAAKAFILYRNERAKARQTRREVPEGVKRLAEESKKHFKNPLGEFVYYRTYARWIESESRRETWVETVDRYIGFMKENLGEKLTEAEYAEVREAILRQEVMPSMRLLQFAGPAARKTNVCAYNCSFIAPESYRDLAEIMYVSMCGTGVGWSVESRNVQKFDQIKFQTGKKRPTHVVADSKEGWADSLVAGMDAWVGGEDIEFDFSLLRPSGARLKTMGGKASGPEPLKRLLAFARQKMLASQGKRLRNIDVHDIICMIGDCVVSGGVRRSAMISLSDLDDTDIRDSKKGAFYTTESQRMLANNSAVYLSKPTNVEFMEEWIALMKSGSGERGIFNRGSLAATLPARRIEHLKTYDGYFDASGSIIGPLGTNPCGEIILQSKQFCNLSEVVARKGDTREDLLRKARLAAIIGTYQATLTNFQYLSREWKDHCEAERLLGVSVTGLWDCHEARDPDSLRAMREESVRANAEYSAKFGINASTCVTCVKPSGTVSQTVDCSSGMHPRHAPYYIRRVRIAATDSLFKMLRDQGVPYQPEVGQSADSAVTYVLEFPVKAPEDSMYKDDLSAIQLLEFWKTVKINFTEHNPSVTISVGEDEWIEVGNWVYRNWDIVGGLSFLPRDNHVYQLAPYEEISRERYEELSRALDHIDYSKIMGYEKSDEIDVKKELACMGNVCEIAL